jgi:hypothetical protein
MSKSPIGVCVSSVTTGAPVARCSASSPFGGRKNRSQTMPSSALKSLYTVWNPRFDIPTK